MSHAKPLVLTPRLPRFGSFTLAVMLLTPSASHGQCPPPCSGPTTPCECFSCGDYTCTGIGLCGEPNPRRCDVYCQQQLLQVLQDEVATGECRHIRIPGNACVDICQPISIGFQHSGTETCPLRIEIVGTVRFVGTPSQGEKVFNISGCNWVTFDGGGNITSKFDPDDNSEIGRAFRIQSASTHVTIENLTISKLSTMVMVEASGATDLTLRNLRGIELGEYGVWTNNRTIAHIENCHVERAVDYHGFRLYGDDISVRDCSAYQTGATGLWAAVGERYMLDGVATEKSIRIGPDPQGGSANDVTENVTAFRLATKPISDVTIEMGTMGACIVNLCSSMTVGRDLNQVVVPRDLDYVNWDLVSDAACIADNPDIGVNVGPVQYSYCFANIDNSDGLYVVNIDDLLAVVAGWGPCIGPPPGAGAGSPHPPCPADIYPHTVAGVCNGALGSCSDHVVNIDDLLDVISSWGPCLTNPPCGQSPARTGGMGEGAPQSIEDCYTKCLNAFPNDENKFAACFDDCVWSLCQTGLISCD